nr:hypothetical protein CFP56_36601 [Quercus suber]
MLYLWFSRIVARGKSVLVHDIDDESHDENDDANDNDESPGFDKVSDFNDHLMDVDTGKDMDGIIKQTRNMESFEEPSSQVSCTKILSQKKTGELGLGI